MDSRDLQNFIDQYSNEIDICPHCGAKVHIKKLWSAYHQLTYGVEFYVIFRCVPCKKLLLKTFILEYFGIKKWNEKFPATLDTELPNTDLQYIPEHIFVDYEEALKCKAIGANRASCTMFRRALQSAVIKLSEDKNDNLIDKNDNLRKQINSLKNLPDDIIDWAHQIRIFGNYGAHPDKDKLKDVTSEEVIEAHDFISSFFIYTFIMPRKVAESQEKRKEKTQPKKKTENNQE